MSSKQVKAAISKGAVFVNRHTLQESTIVRSTRSTSKGTRIVVTRRVPYPPYTVEREIPYRTFLQNYIPTDKETKQ
jgi:hypothetical protein